MKSLLSIIGLIIVAILPLQAMSYVVELRVGESYTCRPNITNYGRSYNWSVSGNSGGAISISGNYSGSTSVYIHAQKPGWAIIKCEGYATNAGFTNYYSDIWEINVIDNKPSSVSISPSSVELDAGSTTTLSAILTPNGADYNSIAWSSSNTGVVRVNGSGLSATATGVSPGTATITATSDNGKSGQCKVTVYGTNPTGMTVSGPSRVEVGYTAELTAAFSPSLYRSTVTWSSSNSNIASVNSEGTVYSYLPGTVTITARSANGLQVRHTIEVYAPELEIRGWSAEKNIDSRPCVSFNKPVYETDGFDNIMLYEGTPDIDKNTAPKIAGRITFDTYRFQMTFTPDQHLEMDKTYTLYIPANALETEYKKRLAADQYFSFTVNTTLPMTLTPTVVYGAENTAQVTLVCSQPYAIIRYTTDGNEPSESYGTFMRSGETIVIKEDCRFKAKAFFYGYSTPYINEEIKVSTLRIVSYFPSMEERGYIYGHPYIEFNQNISWGTGDKPWAYEYFDQECTWSYYSCIGDYYIAGRYLVFVSYRGMDRENYFKITIPAGAILSEKGEPNEKMEVILGGCTTYASPQLSRIDVLNPVIIMQPGETSIIVDRPYPLNVNYYASFESSDPSVADIGYFDGVITAKKEGMTTITITTLSSDITATVPVYVGMLPPLEYETIPEDGYTEFDINDYPYISFWSSEEPVISGSFSDITLRKAEGDGEPVKGSSALAWIKSDGEEVLYWIVYRTYEELEPNTSYVFSAPSDFVTKSNGESLIPDVKVHFKTADWNRMTLTASVEDAAVVPGTAVRLICSEPDAEIHYVVNGSGLTKDRPSRESPLFTEDIIIDKNTRIQAVAYKVGFFSARFDIRYEVSSSTITEIDKQPESFDIYDIYGRKLRAGITSLEGMPKGIYIVNNKKIVVK